MKILIIEYGDYTMSILDFIKSYGVFKFIKILFGYHKIGEYEFTGENDPEPILAYIIK